MKTKFYLCVILAVLVWLTGCGEKGKKTFIIGIINHATVAEGSIPGFKDALAEHGYSEGKNITYIYHGPVAVSLLESEVRTLLDEGVDLILSVTMPATVAAKKVTVDRRVPIVFAPNSNPVGAGLVASMKRPGGNITGVSFWLQEDKRLEWLQRLAPGIKKVFVPYMDWDKSPKVALEKLLAVSKRLDLEIVTQPIYSVAGVKQTADSMPTDIDAVFLPADAFISSNAQLFVDPAIARKIPVAGPQYYSIEKGALFAYGFMQYEAGLQGGHMALRILQGADPATMPVEMTEIFLMLNLKTAKAIGIQIPVEIVGKADKVIR